MADSLTSLMSGGLLSTGAPNYAKMARGSERKRQGLINLGLQQIGAVFGGGTAPFYSPAKTEGSQFSPRNTYYALSGRSGEFVPYWAPGGARPNEKTTPSVAGQLADMSAVAGSGGLSVPLNAMGIGLGNIFGDKESPRDVARKAFRRGQLFAPPTMQTFEGFQEPFFEKRAQDYVNFALPQLGQQYRSTRDAITFGLANRGLSESSSANKAKSDLELETAKNRQQIADTGLAQANQLRQDIEASRAEATRQLYQSADPAQALQSAVKSAIGFGRPSTFQPIANMFTNLAQQYATQQLLNNYRQPYFPAQDDDFSNYLAPI